MSMRILFTGGGTGGPVTPLLAIVEAFRGRSDVTIVGFIGTRYGPERELATRAGIPFFAVSAGKWRRYFDVRNLWSWAQTKFGFFEALVLLSRLRPTIVVSGGSFVGVPVLWAAWFLRIPTVTHQQDVEPSLANRLVAPIVKRITVVFPETARAFAKRKVVVTGNPVRPSLLRGDAARARERFGLESGVPALLVFGGGTGAAALNDLVHAALPELVQFCQVIHITGGRTEKREKRKEPERYHTFELLMDEMADAYAVSDVVFARAGVGTITELAVLGKAAVLMPMPDTHQEANARFVAERHAALVLDQKSITSEAGVAAIRSLMLDTPARAALAERIRTINPPDALDQMVRVIEEVNAK